MKIHEESIGHYLAMLHAGQRFSMAGFSDAEWYCILGLRHGEKTGLGQVLDSGHGQLLLGILRQRQSDPRWIFAVPKCLYGLPSFCNHEIDWFLGRENIRIEAQERDMLTDDLAREAGLYPLIERLQHMRVGMVGPAELKGCHFLGYRRFVEIATPNLHQEPGGIDRAVAEVKRYDRAGMVWCVSAGVSAAVIIDRLHDWRADNWYIDCGSIWDAFVGIGGQRQWRAELYADVEAWVAWKRKCLTRA